MRLLLTYRKPDPDPKPNPDPTTDHQPGSTIDLAIDFDSTATVGTLIRDLADYGNTDPALRTHYDHLTVETGDITHEVAPDQPLDSAGIPDGAVVSPATGRLPIRDLSAPRLVIVSGPGSGRSFPLLAGVNLIGRRGGCHIQIPDPGISQVHARLTVDALSTVRIADLNSANGTLVDGASVSRTRLGTGQRITLGETELRLEPPTGGAARPPGPSGRTEFVRSPRLTPGFAPEEYPAPELPGRPRPQHFPITMLAMPLLLGAGLYAMTGRAGSLLFVALMPMMMIGMWFENRRRTRSEAASAWASFREDLAELGQILSARQDRERLVRQEEHPGAERVVAAVHGRTSLLWSRRPTSTGFLTLRLGLGRGTSRISVATPLSGPADPRAWQELRQATENWRTIDQVPLATDLAEVGAIGVAADPELRAPVCNALVLQLVGLHSPRELVLAALLGASSARRWDWLKWLPHTRTGVAPLRAPRLTSELGPAELLLDELTMLIAQRASRPDDPRHLPLIVLLVEDDCPLDRARLISLAESGPRAGIFLIWGADRLTQIPAAAGAFIAATPDGLTRVGFPGESGDAQVVLADSVSQHRAELAARSLAPLVDASAREEDRAEPPTTVGYLAIAGEGFADDPEEIAQRWRETGSIAALAEPTQRPTTLRALVGLTATDPMILDLIAHGPHALVAGTTGSGKSELLQTWVTALASDYSPDRLNFLFIDYKGGAAFASCLELPHCTGLVTDLTPRLAARVLSSLRAELRRREQLLRKAGANDLMSLEQQAAPDAPARLVIVVDEFAVLAKEIPSFVDGIVDIAQRGRSLGLHLILATQRPAGVIGESLRANTNLRIALRTTDRSDSTDVLGDGTAAGFDPDIPGRAAVRFGSRPVVCFQSAYLGGCTTATTADTDQVRITGLDLGSGAPGAEVGRQQQPARMSRPAAGRDIPTDLERLVGTIRLAAESQPVREIWRPWLPELPDELDLDHLAPAGQPGSEIRIALADQPEIQRQSPVGFDPERAGNLLVIGTSGAGRSTTLRTLAVAATMAAGRGATHIYGLDHGCRGLDLIRELPNVGAIIPGDDHERTSRLLRMLREMVADRSGRMIERQSANLTQFRQLPGAETTPRVLLLLDGLAEFRKTHEGSRSHQIFEDLVALAADGRSSGVHLVVATDRPGSVPGSLAANISSRLVLRLADEGDLAALRLPRGSFREETPPGRGFLDGVEVQVAVPGGSTSLASQARQISRLRHKLQTCGSPTSAPAVPRLPSDIRLTDLPTAAADRPTLGTEYESLRPIGFPADGTILVAGPAGSGRSTAIQTMIRSIARLDEERAGGAPEVIYLSGAPRDPDAIGRWRSLAADPSQIARLLERIRVSGTESVPPGLLLIIEDAPGLVNGPADAQLQELVRELRGTRHCLIAGGDTASLQGSWPLLVALRADRQGLVLRPDPGDGELLFRTPLPRTRRSDFPPGRGVLVADGSGRVVQVAR